MIRRRPYDLHPNTRAARAGIRLLVALGAALWGGGIVLSDAQRVPNLITDQAQVWVAARELAEGHNPYERIGPGREWPMIFAFYYPLTAPLLLWPLKDVTPTTMQVVFVALSAFLLAWAVTRDGWHRLPLFLSPAFIACAKVVQWTPLLASVIWIPWLGFVLAAKPNVGVAVLVASRSWRHAALAAAGALLLTFVSLVLWPGWIGTWRATVSGADHFVPTVLLPGGGLLLMALMRWRRWEGRLLLAMALVPQTPGPVAALLLLLIPGTVRSALLLSLLTAVPYFLVGRPETFSTFAEYAHSVGVVTLWAVYLPALLLVLRMPNEGPAPAWLERWARRWPDWLRGSASPLPETPADAVR